MPEKKKTAEPEAVRKKEPVYSPEQLKTFQRYSNRCDLLSALLQDGETYTTDQVDSLIEHWMKGKVN